MFVYVSDWEAPRTKARSNHCGEEGGGAPNARKKGTVTFFSRTHAPHSHPNLPFLLCEYMKCLSAFLSVSLFFSQLIFFIFFLLLSCGVGFPWPHCQCRGGGVCRGSDPSRARRHGRPCALTALRWHCPLPPRRRGICNARARACARVCECECVCISLSVK